MKIIPLTLTLKQLKELCEKKMTEIVFRNGSTVLRIIVKTDSADC